MIHRGTERVTVKRRTALLLDEEDAAVSPDVDRQPATPSLIEARVRSGTSNTGQVTVTGTGEDGGALQETLVFDGSRERLRTVDLFASVTGVTTSGLAAEATAPKLSLRSLGRGGDPQAQSYDVVTDWPASPGKASQRWPATDAGAAATGRAILLLPYTEQWTPRRGDVVVDSTGAEWLVEGEPRIPGGLRRRHFRLEVTRRDGSS